MSYQRLLAAVVEHVALDSFEEARPICDEAQMGNKVAQYIVGMALLKTDRRAAEAWLEMSAQQGYVPALQYFNPPPLHAMTTAIPLSHEL